MLISLQVSTDTLADTMVGWYCKNYTLDWEHKSSQGSVRVFTTTKANGKVVTAINNKVEYYHQHQQNNNDKKMCQIHALERWKLSHSFSDNTSLAEQAFKSVTVDVYSWDSFTLFQSTYHYRFQCWNSCFSTTQPYTRLTMKLRFLSLLFEALILKNLFFLDYNRGMHKKHK